MKQNINNQTSTTSPLLSALKATANKKLTENGATALSSTLSPLLDLFGLIGAIRSRSDEDIINLFIPAFSSDPLLALKTLFYARDIRGGLGERRVFRVIAHYLAVNHPEFMRVNLALIPEYGRYDDLYTFVGTPLEQDAFAILHADFSKDLAQIAAPTATPPTLSLVAKWLKSPNASSKESRHLAAKTAKAFSLSSKEYRAQLSKLRSALKIVEKKMSTNAWSTIDYSSLPSYAAKNYRHAFAHHDAARYNEYIAQVMLALSSPTIDGAPLPMAAKINADTLFPYDIVTRYLDNPSYFRYSRHHDAHPTPDLTLEAQWKSLPDYLSSSQDSFLIMADTSGSMFTTNRIQPVPPIATSVGLAIYFAERTQGPLANHFITFTDEPRLVEIPSSPEMTLLDKISYVTQDDYVGYGTNLKAAFEVLLKAVIDNNISQGELPKAIVVISDMEIDEFSDDDQTTFTEEMAHRFADAGYTMPTLVYWNVMARANTFHATKSDRVKFVSGLSPSIFKSLCTNLGSSPMEYVIETLSSPRYDSIKLPE